MKKLIASFRKCIAFAAVLLALGLTACNNEGLDAISTVDSSFETADDGWEAEFSEYSTKTDTNSLNFDSGRARLPRGLDTLQYAYMMQSSNRSDDIFMYLKKQVSGLTPNTTYSIVFDVNLATNSPENSMGTGGSPGSSVYLKAGASLKEPTSTLKDTEYKFNLDKGAQSNEGPDAVILGNIANGVEEFRYTLVDRSNRAKPFKIKTDTTGKLWFFVGTDSGFEGDTRIYYNRILITLTQEPAS